MYAKCIKIGIGTQTKTAAIKAAVFCVWKHVFVPICDWMRFSVNPFMGS